VTLDELALKYGSDKCPEILHHYTPFYETLLRGRRIRRVLELGILRGASLRMWRDYFREAHVFGLDINPEVLFEEERIRTRLCDASDAIELAAVADELGGHFDLIVDDASHLSTDQITAAHALWPRLEQGGLLIIEDVAEPTVVSRALCNAYLTVRTADHPFDDCLILIPGVPR
jgi:predicted O-methyltransferase YrrM